MLKNRNAFVSGILKVKSFPRNITHSVAMMIVWSSGATTVSYQLFESLRWIVMEKNCKNCSFGLLAVPRRLVAWKSDWRVALKIQSYVVCHACLANTLNNKKNNNRIQFLALWIYFRFHFQMKFPHSAVIQSNSRLYVLQFIGILLVTEWKKKSIFNQRIVQARLYLVPVYRHTHSMPLATHFNRIHNKLSTVKLLLHNSMHKGVWNSWLIK